MKAFRNPLTRWWLTLGVTMSLLSGCGLAATLEPTPSDTFTAKAAKAGELKLLVMPDAGPDQLLATIKGAKKSILMEMYILTYSGATQEITDALIERSKAGLDVRIILEDQPYIPAPVPKPGELPPPPINVNKAALQVLTAANVRVKRSSMQFNFTHQKSLVIDGHTACIMTMNLSKAAIAQNREYVILDKSPSDVAELTRIFEADWSETPVVPQDPDLVVSPTNSKDKILKLIDQSKKTLMLQCEFIGDPEVTAHLGAAAKRGANVCVQLAYFAPDPKTGDDINGSERQQLAAVGVTSVKFIHQPVMHAKMIVVDHQQAYVGSENMTTNSLTKNREMGILLSDPTIISQLVAVSDKDWAAAK